MKYPIFILQAVVLIVVFVLLWQMWQFLKRKDIPDDEPLGEERAKYLTTRLTILGVCFGIEVVLQVVQFVLRWVS